LHGAVLQHALCGAAHAVRGTGGLGGLLSDFRVIEHAEAFPTQAQELSVLDGLRKFSMVIRTRQTVQFLAIRPISPPNCPFET
ncbi:MAG: hypothetical protein ACLQU2_16460, partial [Candidatus Binataceae bacterium]